MSPPPSATAHAGLQRMGSSSSTFTTTNSLIKVCRDHKGGINWMSLSPDGCNLLTASEDCTARLWRTSDNQCCRLLQGHSSYITFCHLENEVAFTCSADHSARKWEVATGQCLTVYTGHTSIVNRILVSRNLLFSGSYDRTARLWDVDSGRSLQEFQGHRNCVLALAHFSSSDILEASDLEGKEVKEFLVTGSTDCTVKIWEAFSGCCFQTLRGHVGAILCIVLDVPNKELFSGSTDYTIRRWNIVTGDQLKVFRDHQGSVICLEMVGRHLYSGSVDRTAKCWLPDTGECVRTYKSHKHSVSTLQYHAGILFTGSGDTCARAFNTKSGALQQVFPGHTFIINCIQIYDNVLYTASHDGTLRVWDIQEIYSQTKHQKKIAVRSKLSQKGSLPHLFHNKVGCSPEDNDSCEPVELI
ncbi:PREDICTED: WD repeat-containing protein 86 [Nanorana parkeri]|uniref:WD repeat-containing protein 86 n=1 Tax=Nanorana parkeri TaxID=125878 RepID=UPI000854FC81|nr:PREDICTED: WD repeat-containing protein 86 [Nanorana parkeri]